MRNRLSVIILSVLAITSAVSYLVAWSCHLFMPRPEPLKFGHGHARDTAVVTGSSLTFYGLAWARVADALNVNGVGWSVPRASPRELEVLLRHAPMARYTFIGISTFDANENQLSDYRPRIVTLREELAALWSNHVDWVHAKRDLSQYPMVYVRLLFPSAGKSTLLMVSVREMYRKVFHTGPQTVPSEAATISNKDNTHTESIASWPAARVQRNLADVRASDSATEYGFHGVKRQSLFRMLREAAARSKVVVVVLPESPVYRAEILTPNIRRQFDELVADAQSQEPRALWIRLDTVPDLDSSKYYWDLVHLNAFGQATATKDLLTRLAAAGIQ